VKLHEWVYKQQPVGHQTGKTEPQAEIVLERVRNFYGSVQVEESYYQQYRNGSFRALTHGTITHGMQCMDEGHRTDPMTYYNPDNGVGQILTRLKAKPGAHIAIVGMGAGCTACYAVKGQRWRYYEINPGIQDLALKHFTFFKDAQARGVEVTSVLGDGRLTLEREPNQNFDLILLDAFSGDAIPMHLLTREAFDIYKRHLKPDGIVIPHITNRYISLAPMLKSMAKDLGWHTARVILDEDDYFDYTDFFLMSPSAESLKDMPMDTAAETDNEPVNVPMWTDLRHNLFEVLNFSRVSQ
jgi:SAM-dependent methyltransferase